MPDLRETVKSYLQGDTTLMGWLTGGLQDAQSQPRDGGGVGSLPLEADGVTVKAFGVLRWRTSTPQAIVSVTERKFLELYVYADYGYTALDGALRQAKDLLHRHRFSAVSGYSLVMSHWMFDRDELPAEEYGGLPSLMSRYYVDLVRS